MDYASFQSLLDSGNGIAKYLNVTREIQKWVDIESEFVEISERNKGRYDGFLKDYKGLCSALIGYAVSNPKCNSRG